MKLKSRTLFIAGLCGSASAVAACAIFAFTFWPRPGRVERKLADQIIHSCPGRRACLVRFGDVTWFAWDKVYAFDSSIPEQDREKALGVRDPGFVEFSPQFVFTKNGRIVYAESEPTDFEHPTEDEIVFDDAVQSSKSFPPQARFSVTERAGPEGRYFVLKPAQ